MPGMFIEKELPFKKNFIYLDIQMYVHFKIDHFNLHNFILQNSEKIFSDPKTKNYKTILNTSIT